MAVRIRSLYHHAGGLPLVHVPSRGNIIPTILAESLNYESKSSPKDDSKGARREKLETRSVKAQEPVPRYYHTKAGPMPLKRVGLAPFGKDMKKPNVWKPLSTSTRSVSLDRTAKLKQPGSSSSTWHWALSDIYEERGEIKRALNPLKEEVSKWGRSGIPIQWKAREPGEEEELEIFPHLWLRDHCRCIGCVNQDTMQRSLDTFLISKNIMPRAVFTTEEGLVVEWADENHHVSVYSWEWLWKHKSKPNFAENHDDTQVTTYWGAEVKANPPSVHYDEIMADDKGVGKWTAKIREYGFCFVDGCPVSPQKTQELLERIAFIRITHYGGFYDFTSDLTMKDTAYTSLALAAHTDTTYFTDPAGLQMFHLLSHTSGNGGASLLVDGFHAADVLYKEDPGAFATLAQTPIPFHASGNLGITITPSRKYPVLQRGQRHTDSRLSLVRWNNDDRGTVPLNLDQGSSLQWYAAARKWNDILKRQNMEYWEQLVPGRPLIFDNWRVLHGRSAFTGKRRICGGYINRDDFVSRWRNTNFTREEALAQIL